MNIIEAIEKAEDFVMFEDGFIYYCPSKEGGLAAHHLREIADELDRRNAAWQSIIDNDPRVCKPKEEV